LRDHHETYSTDEEEEEEDELEPIPEQSRTQEQSAKTITPIVSNAKSGSGINSTDNSN